jgi:predicted transcriptional regulator
MGVWPSQDTLLERVLESLESGLQVGLIASLELAACEASDRPGEVLSRSDWLSYSQLAVRDEGKIVGVLERSLANGHSGTVREVMRPLSDEIIVEAATGILSYIPLAAERPYHLVVRGGRIDGIVTRSDLLSLPVRVVLFTFLTQLESAMASAIRKACPDGQWADFLKPERRKRIDARFEEGKRRDVYADRLNFSEWSDKREILASVLPAELLGSKTRFHKELKELERLRDKVMHANDYLSDAGGLGTLVASAREWIRTLSAFSRGTA